MSTIIKKITNGFEVTLSGENSATPYFDGSCRLRPYPNNKFSLFWEGSVIIENAYVLDIINGETGNVFADYNALKTYVDSFFPDAGVTPGIPVVTKFLRQAATRCFIPRNFVGTGVTYNMSASYHVSKDKLVNPILLMPNFRISAHNDVAGTEGIIAVSVECPIGSTPIFADLNKANGNNPVPFTPGIMPMKVTMVIPDNTPFLVRTYQYNANGVPWFQYQSGYIVPPFESCDIGSGTGTNKTAGGTLSAPTNATFTPCAILSETDKQAFILVADSREEDGTGMITDRSCDVGIAARTIGAKYGYISFAESGSLLAQWNAATRPYRDMLILGTVSGVGDGIHPYATYLSMGLGINDVSAGDTAVVLAGRRATFAALYNTKVKVIGQTMPPYVTFTNAMRTRAGQGLGVNQARVAATNTLIRAGIPGESFYWDISDAVDPLRLNSYAVTSNEFDTALTPTCDFTGALSDTTLTVSAIANGYLKPGDTITDNLTNLGSIQPGTVIVSQLTGTLGSTGTYKVNKPHKGFPYANAVTSKAMYTGAVISNDGLHLTATGTLLVKDSGVINLKRLDV